MTRCITLANLYAGLGEQASAGRPALGVNHNDTETPRNIRRITKQASEELFKEKYNTAVRAADSIKLIEEIINDPNMPSFAGTQLWMAISIFETIRSSHQ